MARYETMDLEHNVGHVASDPIPAGVGQWPRTYESLLNYSPPVERRDWNRTKRDSYCKGMTTMMRRRRTHMVVVAMDVAIDVVV